jgi:hypothetical protein
MVVGINAKQFTSQKPATQARQCKGTLGSRIAQRCSLGFATFASIALSTATLRLYGAEIAVRLQALNNLPYNVLTE